AHHRRRQDHQPADRDSGPGLVRSSDAWPAARHAAGDNTRSNQGSSRRAPSAAQGCDCHGGRAVPWTWMGDRGRSPSPTRQFPGLSLLTIGGSTLVVGLALAHFVEQALLEREWTSTAAF